MAKPIWKPLPINHSLFKEGRFYIYTTKKPHKHKLSKEKNNLINASEKEKEVEK